MKKWLQRWKSKYGKDGASLVSVVVGMVFLTAIGTVVLLVSSQFFTSVIIDNNASNNFYEAEGVLSEVRSGVLEYAEDASEYAYKDVMKKYTTLTAKQRKTFAKEYISYIATKLISGSNTPSYTWNDDELKTGPITVNGNIDYLKCLSTQPDVVKTSNPLGLQFMIASDKKNQYTLTIKDLVIDLTNDADYRSTIQTDICISIPDLKFEGDSTTDQLKDYVVISDDTLSVGTIGAHSNVGFKGNVYTGVGAGESNGKIKDSIVVNTQSSALFNSDTIISRGNLTAYTGAYVNMTGETGLGDLWLPNIILKPQDATSNSDLSTTLAINDNCYIENDLDIRDNNALVTLSGKYYGYSFNEENTKNTSEANADYSSAILINGLNTTLKTNGLEKLILAGRSFVERHNEDGAGSAVQDIQMGESLAVKSNQIAYLLPDRFIGPGHLEHNPVSSKEYEEYSKDKANPLVAEDELLQSDIRDYLNETEPYTENYSNTGGYVFLYLNFKDEDSANKYFEKYYKGTTLDENQENISNKEQLEERAQSYISTTDDTGMKLSPSLYLIAANIIHNYYATNGSSFQAQDYFDDAGNPNEELLQDGRDYGWQYVGRQKTLLPSGGTSMRMDKVADPLVTTKIIDVSAIPGREGEYTDDKGEIPGAITIKSGDYTVDSSTKQGIVVVDGNVTVTSNFKGLILASGTVTVTGTTVLVSDMVTVDKLLQLAAENKDLTEIFRGFDKNGPESSSDLSQCIAYKNWSRND